MCCCSGMMTKGIQLPTMRKYRQKCATSYSKHFELYRLLPRSRRLRSFVYCRYSSLLSAQMTWSSIKNEFWGHKTNISVYRLSVLETNASLKLFKFEVKSRDVLIYWLIIHAVSQLVHLFQQLKLLTFSIVSEHNEPEMKDSFVKHRNKSEYNRFIALYDCLCDNGILDELSVTFYSGHTCKFNFTLIGNAISFSRR